MKNKIYFQDYPIKDYKDDIVGFEAEIEMLKEGIESDSKIIGLVAEYGSGKSSIIELLRKELGSEYRIVNINLLDPDSETEALEAHKRMLIQLANNKYSENPQKLSYITKRLNKNYKSVDISTKSKSSIFWIIVAIFFLFIAFLQKSGMLASFNSFQNSKYTDIINIFREITNISGAIGIMILFITIIRSGMVCNYFKNDDKQELNEMDLIEISNDLIDTTKTTVIIIEDLDRNLKGTDIDVFVKELNTYYRNMKKCKFVIAITPEQFNKMSGTTKIDGVDRKYKPFNMVICIPSIKNSDYETILRELLKSKKKDLESVGIDVDKTIEYWTWLSLGKQMNIRRLKHRVNDTIHRYRTIKSRFPGSTVELKTCIAITYLKDEYEDVYEKLLKQDNNNQFSLKSEIEKYIIDQSIDNCNTDFDKDLRNLVIAGYIDYNCEKYCYNYSKYNGVFDIYENELFNDYIYDREYKIDESKIEDIIKNNSTWLKNAIDKRLTLGIGLPTNVFNSVPIINYLLGEIDEEDLKKYLYGMLMIDEKHIKTTIDRLNKIKGSKFFDNKNLQSYIKETSKKIQESGDMESISSARLALIDIMPNTEILKELYINDYPIITKEEMIKIGNIKEIITLIDFAKVNIDNIKYIIEAIDILYKEGDKESILYILGNIYDEVVDCFCKNCKSLSKLTVTEKEELFEENKKYINLSTLKEIQTLTNNIGYSFKKTEEKIITMLDSNLINIKQYESYIKGLPNVNDCTLNRLLKDDCKFSIQANILDNYEKSKDLFGYVKFKTINDGEIPTNKKKYFDVYERMYSNDNHIFDDYIIDNSIFLNYIRDMKVYEKYGNDRFIIMAHCSQTTELLNYAFKSLSDTSMLSEYINEIETIDCDEIEFGALLLNYKSLIVGISSEAYMHLQSFIKNKSIKAKLRCVRSGKNVQNNIYS